MSQPWKDGQKRTGCYAARCSVSLPSTRLKEAIVPISSQKLSLALHKAILALEVLNRKDGRWMLYAQAGWLFAKRLNLPPGTVDHGQSYLIPEKQIDAEQGVHVFKESNIHGIYVKDQRTSTSVVCIDRAEVFTRICLYGDHSFRLFDVASNSEEGLHFQSVCPERLLQDWIVTARILEDDRIALISAHNRLSIFNADAFVCQSTFSCADSHILYSAFIHEETNDQVIIFGGTVFNYISIWSSTVSSSAQTTQSSCGILHKLQAHAGVIFDVIYDEKQRLICSTSDDRSCRVHQVDFQKDHGQKRWASATFQLVHALYGHEARVWRVRVLPDAFILTIGEDLRLCAWNGKEGRMVKQWSAQHTGLNIWSVTTVQSEDGVMIFTGGADGSIFYNFLDVKAWGKAGGDAKSVTSDCSTAPQSKRVRRVSIVDEGHVLVLVDGGLLYSVELDTQQWSLKWDDSQLKQCVALVTQQSLTAVVTCGGKVAILDGEKPQWQLDLACHCLEGVWVKNAEWNTSILLASGPSGTSHLVTYDSVQKSLVKTASLSTAKTAWITAAAQRHDVLLCGDRGGSLRLFGLEADVWKERQVLLHVHGQSEVCQVDFSGSMVLSAGRSGQIIHWRLPEQGSLQKLRVVQPDKTVIEWIAGFLLPADSTADFLIYGFRSNKFTVWSSANNEKLLECECGGGHRSYDLAFFPHSGLLRFASVKTTTVNWHRAILPSGVEAGQGGPVRLTPALHGLQIWSVVYLGIDSEGSLVLATASEDTTIKVISSPLKKTIDDVMTEMSVICTGREHLSSVRVVKQSCLMSDTLYSAGGRGQLLMWHCADAEWSANVTVMGSWSLYSQVVRKKWSDQAVLQPDTRIMDLDVLLYSSQVEIVVTASSDGVLRCFVSRLDTDQYLTLLGQSEPFDCCLLKVQLVKYGSVLWAVASGTDGLLRILNVTDLASAHSDAGLSPGRANVVLSLRLHQSGIDALDVRVPLSSPTRLQVATGGDDGAICLARFDCDMALRTVSQICNAGAHNAQISGLSWVNTCQVVSVSKDQLVKMWHVDWTDETMVISRCLYTCVADVASISLYILENSPEEKDLFLAVAGAGFQLLHLPSITLVSAHQSVKDPN